MLPYRDSKLTRVIIGIFFLIVAGYAYYEVRGFLFGPRINVPEGISEVGEQFIVLQGTADRIATLKMNGKTISVTEDGAFEEPYLLAEGLNRIVFDAEDKYGRTSQETIEILYTPATSSKPWLQIATTTPAADPTSTTSVDVATSSQ